MVRKTVITFISLIAMHAAFADLDQTFIPSDTGGLYYQIGGGDVTPLPFTGDANNMSLDVGGNANLGLNCQAFDPAISAVDSLNGVSNTFGNITQTVERNLTSMVIGELGYQLRTKMPNVYGFIRDGLSFNQGDVSLATKSCETMLSDDDQGINPMKNWAQASIGQHWKYNVSLANTQAATSGALGNSTGDIVQANRSIGKSGGKYGVQWVRGISQSGQLFAGGQGQPAIYLISDTTIAGYNVLVGNQRPYDDTSSPAKTSNNQGLVSVFSSPKNAAVWLTAVVGEQEISTYSGGTKKSLPGKGLLNDIQTQASTIKQKLASMIAGQTALNITNLKLVSAPKVMIDANTIKTLKHIKNRVDQAIWVNRLAQEIAVARVISKAKLGLNLLEVGAQVPAIAMNSAAQSGIQSKESYLSKQITSLRNDPKDSKEFVSGTISTLMNAQMQKELANDSIRPTSTVPPAMQNGAIMKGSD